MDNLQPRIAAVYGLLKARGFNRDGVEVDSVEAALAAERDPADAADLIVANVVNSVGKRKSHRDRLPSKKSRDDAKAAVQPDLLCVEVGTGVPPPPPPAEWKAFVDAKTVDEALKCPTISSPDEVWRILSCLPSFLEQRRLCMWVYDVLAQVNSETSHLHFNLGKCPAGPISLEGYTENKAMFDTNPSASAAKVYDASFLPSSNIDYFNGFNTGYLNLRRQCKRVPGEDACQDIVPIEIIIMIQIIMIIIQYVAAYHGVPVIFFNLGGTVTRDFLLRLYKIGKLDGIDSSVLDNVHMLTDGSHMSYCSRLRWPHKREEDQLLKITSQAELVSLEIVEEIIQFYPEAAKLIDHEYGDTRGESGEIDGWGELGTSYPLHAACWNKACPLSVIELLVAKHPAALRHLGIIEDGLSRSPRDGLQNYVEGTPLSYYLERKTNLTLEGVILLVDACPEALKMADELKRLSPLHTLTLNSTLSDHFAVLEFIVRSDPSTLRMVDCFDARRESWRDKGSLPLHLACDNGNASGEIVRFLVESWPGSINEREWSGCFPLHCICRNEDVGDDAAMEIMKILVQADPSKVSEGCSRYRDLPLHYAAGKGRRSREFCEYLVNQFPESIRIGNSNNTLPLQSACIGGCLSAVKYLAGLFPEALDRKSVLGFFPIHSSLFNKGQRSEIIDFIRSLDPNCLSKRVDGGNPFDGGIHLHIIMRVRCPEPDNGVKHLFDAYPESIFITTDLGHRPREVGAPRLEARNSKAATFLEIQEEYALKARKTEDVTVPDGEGRLLLHRAILDKEASLGAIKLLVSGNPSAVGVEDNSGLLPVHLACSHGTPDIVEYLLALNHNAQGLCDVAGDNLLHYACRSGNSGAVNVLLEKCPCLASSENSNGVLPVHLMCDKTGKDHATIDSVEYTEAIWRLLLAEPASVSSAADNRSTLTEEQINGKRKRGC